MRWRKIIIFKLEKQTIKITLNNLIRLKVISPFVAILVLLLQIIPNQQNEDLSNQKFPEVSFCSSLFVLNVISNPYQQNLERQNPELNHSPANSIYNKNDITSITDLTDAKKIYNGGFSLKFSVSTFLTVVFSTGT